MFALADMADMFEFAQADTAIVLIPVANLLFQACLVDRIGFFGASTGFLLSGFVGATKALIRSGGSGVLRKSRFESSLAGSF